LRCDLGSEKAIKPVYERTIGPEKTIVIPGEKATKFSIVAAITGIVLSSVGEMLFDEGSPALSVTNFAATVVLWAGVLGAGAGLAKVQNKGLMLVAFLGVLLNCGLLTTGLVKSPISVKANVGPKNISAKEGEARPMSGQSRRTMVTKDWTAGNTIELTDYNFDEVVGGSNMPVLVDFWAPWCGPCRMMGPVIEEIAASYEGKVKVGKLNVDVGCKTAAKFGVESIPTIILFKRGRAQKQWVGVTDRQEISAAIERQL
jgi:thioredoxin 1